jgi:hypothetical protein
MTSGRAHLAAIDADTACRVLAAPERRAILDYLLRTTKDAVDFETLAKYVETQQDNTTTEAGRDGSGDALAMVVLELLHQHLPQLEAAGLIDFDSRSEAIVLINGSEKVRPVLDALEAL